MRIACALLSLFIPGLGQLCKGQILNGIAWFCIVCIGYAMFIVPGIILHLVCIAGAASGPGHPAHQPLSVHQIADLKRRLREGDEW